MKPSFVALTLVSAVLAQDLGGLPQCAQSCLAQFTTGGKIGDCDRLDAKCICQSNGFISGIACCVTGVCNAQDQQAAINFAHSFCATQGVTDLPDTATCASSASGSPTATGATMSTMSPTTSMAAATQTGGAQGFAELGKSVAVYGGMMAALAIM